ncbi:MAG: UDP-N-acetylmuramoyl-L-alanyl-D-glutamate--2,6-diaminopimelate ligase [Clostridia bacterium]|nr:UDP-N-acetylmuramoyl-L-alanyl-D-glutamate--2,6-diaminopimelate ligase [Clostridia bacterium]
MRFTEIIKELNGEICFSGEDIEREIHSIQVDSRKRVENGLFVCIKGERTDAHLKATEAIKNGAVALIVEKRLNVSVPQILVLDSRVALGKAAAKFYGKPAKSMKVIGITGTNGKTTTSYMLSSILEQEGKKVGVIGTLGVRYGEKNYPSILTTPDPLDLHKTFADMRANGVEYVVMEVSAHALYYKKTAGIEFSACIFTNLTQDHLDFFKNMQSYKEAKERLFQEYGECVAILNGDDECGREIGKFREKQGKGKTLFYGLNTPADSFAIITADGLEGTECMLNISDKLCRISLSILGRHNVYNALAAATCATELGVSMTSIARGLMGLENVSGRLEYIGSHRDVKVYVDFAHTPDALRNSLETLKRYCKGRLLCLFGCGGNRDKGKRAIMGENAAKYADFTILTSDNPRYEDPLDIIADIERGHRRFSSRYVVVPDRETAIDYALDFSKGEDILLIAGKGAEDYQEIMGIKYPFKDNDITINLLKKKEKELR